MIKEDNTKEFWETVYTSKDHYIYGKEPSTYLQAHYELLTKGAALDLGMGEGRNAVFLAQKGFTVTGIDHSPTAVARAKELAQNVGVDIEIKETSLDFFLIPLMKYDTIIISDFRPGPALMKNLIRGLTVGGTLMVEAYSKEQLTIRKDPPYAFECFEPNEALMMAQGLHVIDYQERLIEGEHRVGLLGVKTSMGSAS